MLFDDIKNNVKSIVDEFHSLWRASEINRLSKELLHLNDGFLLQIRDKENISANQVAAINSRFSQNLSKTINGLDVGSLYLSIHNLKSSRALAEGKIHPLLSSRFHSIETSLNDIWDALNHIAKFSKYNKFISLIGLFESIRSTIKSTAETNSALSGAQAIMHEEVHALKSEVYFSLGFDAELLTIGEFVAKVETIRKIYEEICFIFDVEHNRSSLKIAKIESGSLFAGLVGDTVVVGFFIWFLKEAIQYLYRNYTAEGKLAKTPQKVEAINQQIDILGKLKEISPDKFKEIEDKQMPAIEKSFAVLSKQFNCLLERETKIKVNDSVLPIYPSNPNELPEPPGKKFLE